MKLVDVMALHVEQDTGAAVVLLREQEEPHRVVPIFIGAPEAASIALAANGGAAPRPLAHDLLVSVIGQLEGTVERVEVTELRDGAFIAEMALTRTGGRHHAIDARPSDAIAVALRVGAPVYVRDAVLDEAGAQLEELDGSDEPDEERIEAEVQQFRSFLEGLDPSSFGDVPPPPETGRGG